MQSIAATLVELPRSGGTAPHALWHIPCFRSHQSGGPQGQLRGSLSSCSGGRATSTGSGNGDAFGYQPMLVSAQFEKG